MDVSGTVPRLPGVMRRVDVLHWAGGGAAAATAALAAACGGQEAAPARRGPLPAATVDFFFSVASARLGEWESQIVAPFTAKYPGVKVNLQAASGDFITTLVALVAAGSSPDALESGGWNARPLALNKLLQPIDDLLKRDKVALPKVSQRLLTQGATLNGRYYAIPYATGGSPAMMYNRAIFQEAGVAEPPDFKSPWTWDQWLDAMRKLTKKQDTDVQRFSIDQLGQNFFLPALWGGQWMSDDLKTVLTDSPAVIDAYTKWYEATAKIGIAPVKGGTELNERFGRGDHFLNGKVAVSSGVRARLRDYAQAADFDCAFCAWPKPTVSTPEVYPHGLALMPPTAKREQAWAWITYLYEGSRFAIWQARPPLVPADVASWAVDLYKTKPRARTQVFAQGIEVAVPPDPYWDHPKSNDMDKEYVQPALTRIMNGEVTAAEELRRIKAPMQALANRA